MGFSKLMWFASIWEPWFHLVHFLGKKNYPKIVSFAFLLSSPLGSPARLRPYLINLAAIWVKNGTHTLARLQFLGGPDRECWELSQNLYSGFSLLEGTVFSSRPKSPFDSKLQRGLLKDSSAHSVDFPANTHNLRQSFLCSLSVMSFSSKLIYTERVLHAE